MAESAAAPSPPSTSSEKKNSKRRKLKKPPLGFRASLTVGDDPFALIAGGTEGGFLSLEEIDEAEYGFVGGIQDVARVEKNPETKKKRTREDGNGESGDAGSCVVQADRDEKKVKMKQEKKKKKSRKKKMKRKKLALKESEEKVDEPVVANVQDELLLGEDEVYAWMELRLHPLLIRSIRKLGFREPTPIQKACVPAAAHKGKDVIGAAETGSGKTLAFGLPILQRLLEEREKSEKSPKMLTKEVKEGSKGGPLRALIVTPTRELALQVSDHLKDAAKFTDIRVVPIVGGMSTEKQERLLKRRPEIIVGTPGRLWEIMSGGHQHLFELHMLSFFVLDEADRMIESGHFHELQSIVDMLPKINDSTGQSSETTQLSIKKRQTFVFSATIALSNNFRRKLKRGSSTKNSTTTTALSSIETLSERAGMRADAEIVDLTSASIVADKLEESFIECSLEDKEAYLCYILTVHGQGRTLVFCTSISALRRISSLLRIIGINAWTLHAQMQQRARLKAVDRFRENENAVLVATDVAARGLDIAGIRTVVHYQLPHSAEVYVHRSGRTARASADGCCIALISPGDKSNFFALCSSLLKESLRQFPLDDAYMPEVMKRVSLARQIDKILRKSSQEKSKKSWLERNAESIELAIEDNSSEEEKVKGHKQNKADLLQLKKLQQELKGLLARPLHSKTFSRRFLAGAGVSPLLQQQLEELSKRKSVDNPNSKEFKRTKLVVIGQDCVEPLQALRTSGREVSVNADSRNEKRKLSETWKKQRLEDKKRAHEQRRKERKKKKEGLKS